MSKTVTIPTDGMNPFVVIFNGVKYVYTPGETVEVPDGVALEIEEYKRWREKHPGENVPPFGAQPDWNQNDPNAPDYVKNRPFYDNRDKIEYTFDGNLEGKETFNAGPAVFVKVSSSTPDIPSIQEIEATFVPVGEDGEVFEEETILISDFGQVAEDIFSTQNMAFAIVLKDTIFNGITITKGVYLSKGDNGSYISRVFFKFDTGELKKLDKKYLPDGIGSLIITTYPYDQKILHSPHGLYEILRESWIKRMAVDIKVYSYNDYNSDTGCFVPHKIDSYQYDAAEDRFEIYFNNIQNAIYVNADGTVEYIILD